jgi:hypothetical protein
MGALVAAGKRSRRVKRAFVEVDATDLDTILRELGHDVPAEALRLGRIALEDVRAKVLPLLPRRTGALREGLEVVARADAQGAEVALVSRRQGSQYVKWSRYTVEQLRARVEGAAARGTTPEAQEAIRRSYAGKLRSIHGLGAPSEDLAGRRVWSQYVAPLARKAVKPISADLARHLGRLVKGG